MTIFSRVSENLEKNRQNRIEGRENCIPWLDLPKLGTIIPGIEKKKYSICTAFQKVK